MIEKDYRLMRLNNKFKDLKGKRIALYGTGINAKAVLDQFKDLNIIAIMDEVHEGEYIYGKKVISQNEVLILGVEVIIIAAELSSAIVVADRILDFCVNNKISLINMYGCDEVEIRRCIMEQDLEYSNMTEDKLRKDIEAHDVICFQLQDVLCSTTFYNEESKWRKVIEALYGEKIEVDADNFFRARKAAEENVIKGRTFSTKDIYNELQQVMFIEDAEISVFVSCEENVIVNNVFAREEMVHILNWANEQGKVVYIYSDLHISRKNVKTLLNNIGVKDYQEIIQENLLNMTMSKGAFRSALGTDIEKRILFVGTNTGINLFVPKLYGADVFMVKNAWDMMKEFSAYNFDEAELNKQNKQEHFFQLVQKEFTSVFPNNGTNGYKGQLKSFAKKEKTHMKEGQKNIEIFELPQCNNLQELEVLNFVENGNPLVSIIIPVFNQFAYTYNCLRAILANTNAKSTPYEIVLADDCSTDFVSEIDKVVKGIRIIRNTDNLMFLRNCNNAAQYAKGKYLVFLNNDTQVQLNWLYPLVQLLESDSRIGMVGAKLVYPDGTLQEAGGIIWNDGTGCNYGRGENPDDPKFNYVREVDYISGAAIMLSKELWQDIGGFDDRYYPSYYEDTDLAFEVRKRNLEVVFQPASVVVHFEGISNGNDLSIGIKSYQEKNRAIFLKKWSKILALENHNRQADLLSVADRKGARKTVVFFSWSIPTYDSDAGSKSIFSYLTIFLKKGYVVKFVAANFIEMRPYVYKLQQMGIQVLYGTYYKKNINAWLLEHQDSMDYAFINYPHCAEQFLPILKCTNIKLRYYGHDLHYLRNKREYELTNDITKKELSETFYKLEKELVQNIEKVYYPSSVEVDLVKSEFGVNDAKQISLNIYDESLMIADYEPTEREGILFVGGFNHTPNIDAVKWFAEEIYPEIYRKKEIPFYIVGSNEPLEIQKIAHPGIIHKGFVSDSELIELYKSVKMVVIPLRYGAGVKGKVVDSLYYGVPMVSTTIGIEGIPEAEDWIDVADEADDFSNKLLQLYSDTEILKEKSRAYQEIVRKYFSQEAAWKIIREDFE